MKGVLLELCNGPLAEATDLEATKQLVLERVKPSNLPFRDKAKIILAVQEAQTLERLQQYCYNAMLKFSGLGTVRVE